MMDFLGRTDVMIAMGALLILLIVGLPVLLVIGIIRATRTPKRRDDDAKGDQRPDSS